MDLLITTVISNAVVVALLAAAVWLVDRSLNRPALTYLFAVLVLIKLLTPPLVLIELPLPQALAAAVEQVQFPARWLGTRLADGWSAKAVVLAVWIAGSLLVLSRSLIVLSRFHRRHVLPSQPPAPEQFEEYQRLGERLAIRDLPTLLLTETRASPMLWAVGPWTRILFPRELFETLSPSARQSLLAHELIHFQRQDHWVRPLELVCQILCWWHPALGFLQRIIHRRAEECCDAAVIAALGEPRIYADAILATLDYYAGPDGRDDRPPSVGMSCATSAVGTDAGVRHVRERLTHIMRRSVTARLSPLGRIAILSLGGFAVVVHPQPERPPQPLVSSVTSAAIRSSGNPPSTAHSPTTRGQPSES